jgi:nicotinate phosphoribosyltransferase
MMRSAISWKDIRDGRATDRYFLHTEDALEHAGKNPHVVAEVTADQFPSGEFEVFAGLPDLARMFEGFDVDVDALREGQLFDGGPVMRIEGPYLEFARWETSLLGYLSHASGIATKALEARRAAPETTMLSFGGRHVHPTLAVALERAALIGGLDGTSHVAAADALDREATGTMPHALMLAFGKGNQEDAWTAFDEAAPEDVPRIALCDTFTDEVDEVVRAVETLSDDLDGVRLDTTGSRRGDFRHIIKEVQWELDTRGYGEVDVVISGGLGADEIREYRDVVDGFGVGSYVSNADPVDFGLDIIEIDGEPTAKRGKLPGVKEVYRVGDQHRVRLREKGAPADAAGNDAEPLLQPLLRDGEIVREFDLKDAAALAQRDANGVNFGEEEAQ